MDSSYLRGDAYMWNLVKEYWAKTYEFPPGFSIRLSLNTGPENLP
jgi:hypothetical protein